MTDNNKKDAVLEIKKTASLPLPGGKQVYGQNINLTNYEHMFLYGI